MNARSFKLTVCFELCDEGMRKWEETVGGSFARLGQSVGLVAVEQYARVEPIVGQEIAQPENFGVGRSPCIDAILV